MISFYGLLDFFPNRIKIKEEFDKLTLDEKILYKKEVYSICFEREYTKDLIWEYLNDWEYSQFDLGKEYRIKKERAKKNNKNKGYVYDKSTDTFKAVELE